MDISSIKPTADNVLIQLAIHTDYHTDRLSPGGNIILPRMRNIESEDAILATVVAAGPGHYDDKYCGPERGTEDHKHGPWIPLDSAIVPGCTVILERAALAGDRIYSDERQELRMIKAHCIAAVIEE